MYAQIEKDSNQYAVQELCEAYEVSRSGYYKWLKRKGKLNRYELWHRKLDELVMDIHSHFPDQGYRTVNDTLLLQTGLLVSDHAVWRSMQRLGITGFVRKSKKPQPSGREHVEIKNELKRQFYSDKPLTKIVTDITYIRHKGKWYFLSCFLDLFNNEIIDYELSDSLDNFLVINPAKRILKNTKSTATPILLHSDQGSQYSSAGYVNLLKSYNIIQSMSRAGTPRDNAVMESFFGRFKDVLRARFQYWKHDDIHFVVDQAIHYFNYIRPVRKLNRKPPVQFRIEPAA